MIMLILTIFGSIGLFLYGMKLLSEALQRFSNGSMRNVMNPMKGSMWARIASGALVTAAVQSSSAVTVMIVSFVNAGLISLRQAIGYIFGANIGTTITAWVICIFGFGLNLGNFSVPLAGLGFALILLNKSNSRTIGNLIMGIALLFMGMDILQTTLTIVMPDSMVTEFLSQYSDMGYASDLLFLLVGILITALVQSSSATITLTLIMCSSGWLPIEAGAAMILGENIGTTITANLASVVANTNAKRTAISHTIINLGGVIWALPALPFMMDGIEWLLGVIGISKELYIPMSLAMYHSLFNIINVSIMAGLNSQIASLACKIIPMPKIKESGARLTILESGILSTSELAVVQAKGEIVNHARRTMKMFGFVRNMFRETDINEFEKLANRVEKYAIISDRVENEIMSYIAEVSRGDLSRTGASQLQCMFRELSHLEIITQSNLDISELLQRKRIDGLWFNQDLRDKLSGMLDLVEQSLYLMISFIDSEDEVKREKIKSLNQQIDLRYATFLKEQTDLSQNREYKQASAIMFLELTKCCDKISNSATSIVR